MSQKQLNKYVVITKLIDGHITVSETAESLGLSNRQIQRLKKGMSEKGAAALIHGNTERTPQHATPDSIVNKNVDLPDPLSPTKNITLLVVSNSFNCNAGTLKG